MASECGHKGELSIIELSANLMRDFSATGE